MNESNLALNSLMSVYFWMLAHALVIRVYITSGKYSTGILMSVVRVGRLRLIKVPSGPAF